MYRLNKLAELLRYACCGFPQPPTSTPDQPKKTTTPNPRVSI